MADDIVLPGTGAIVAADEVAGKKYQRVKLSTGPDGTAVDNDPTHPIYVAPATGHGLATEAGQQAIVTAIEAISPGGGSGGDASAANQVTGNQALADILAKIIAAPSTEAKQDLMITALAGLHTDLATTLAPYLDGLEGLIGTSNSALASLLSAVSTTIAGYVDGLEALTTASNTKLDSIHTDLATTLTGLITTLNGYVDGLETLAAAPLAAGTNTIGKIDHTTTGIGHGKKTVTTAGTDLAIANSTPAKWATVQAYSSNTGKIAIGGAGVDATIATGDGILLNPGESVTLPVDNLADVFVDATVSGEGVRFTYGT